jgi:membrane protein
MRFHSINREGPRVLSILKGAFKGFGKDECGMRAAALSYYTIFALPPLLILLVTIAGKVWGPDEVQRALETQFAGIVGQSGAQQVHQMIEHGTKTAGGGLVAAITSVFGLLLGATGAFISLQDALNHAWEVKPDPKQGGVKNFIFKRLLSLGMVLGLGFLFAVSLAISAFISAIGGAVGGASTIMHIIELIVSIGVLTVLFAALFKFLPDAKVAWRDVWIGAAVTAVLFVIGKFAIGLYLGHSKPGDSFGAASALAVILVWVYYAGMIVLFGAEFTQEWATQRGRGIEPEKGAVRIIEREERVDVGAGQGGRTHGVVPVAASNREPVRRASGGIGDWLVGLPVLYLLFKDRPARR